MANGLLDFLQTPEGQGILSAAFGGLATARRGAPLNSLGRAGMAGLSGYAGAQDRQQMAQNAAVNKELRDMQIAQMRAGMQQQQRDQQIYGQVTSPTEPQIGMNDMGLPVVEQASVPRRFDPAAALRQGMSAEAVKRFAEIEAMSNPKREVYKPGDVVYEGNRPVISIPKEPTVPDAVRQFEYSLTNPDFADYQRSLKRAGAPMTNINMSQEKEEAKAVGKGFGEEYLKIQTAGTNAQNSLNRMSRLGQLLEGVDTGKFAPLGLEVAKASKALGVNIDPNISNKEAALALSNEIALQLRNPSGGAGMPGAMSDADRNFLASMVPGLEKTPDGRRLILESARKLAQRDIEVAKMAREYRKKKMTLDEGFYDELARYSEANPLFQQSAPVGADLFNRADSIIRGGR